MLAREPRARAGFGVLLEIKTTRLRRVVSPVRHPRRQALTLSDRGTQIIDNSRALGFAASVPTDTYAKVLKPSSEVREHWHIHCFIPSLAPRRP